MARSRSAGVLPVPVPSRSKDRDPASRSEPKKLCMISSARTSATCWSSETVASGPVASTARVPRYSPP